MVAWCELLPPPNKPLYATRRLCVSAIVFSHSVMALETKTRSLLDPFTCATSTAEACRRLCTLRRRHSTASLLCPHPRSAPTSCILTSPSASASGLAPLPALAEDEDEVQTENRAPACACASRAAPPLWKPLLMRPSTLSELPNKGSCASGVVAWVDWRKSKSEAVFGKRATATWVEDCAACVAGNFQKLSAT